MLSKRVVFGIMTCAALTFFTIYQVIVLLLYSVESNNMYRGFMIDCARQFFNVTVITSIIDQLAINNYTHLRVGLSNNERFSYLSSFDDGRLAKANGNTEYFTTDDINNLVKYGRDHGITVYGEIEFMGHAEIWKSVYPEVIKDGDEFNMKNIKTYKLIKSALNEIIPLFDGKYWHMSQDEISQPNSEIKKSLNLVLDISSDNNVRPIIWDDPITQNEIDVERKFIIQAWHNNVVNDLTSKDYDTIISEMDYWYIGGSENVLDYNVSALMHPKHILGAELVWFTNSSIDDPSNITWIFSDIEAAGIKMQEIQEMLFNS